MTTCPCTRTLRSPVSELVDFSGVEDALRVRHDVVEHVELPGGPGPIHRRSSRGSRASFDRARRPALRSGRRRTRIAVPCPGKGRARALPARQQRVRRAAGSVFRTPCRSTRARRHVPADESLLHVLAVRREDLNPRPLRPIRATLHEAVVRDAHECTLLNWSARGRPRQARAGLLPPGGSVGALPKRPTSA